MVEWKKCYLRYILRGMCNRMSFRKCFFPENFHDCNKERNDLRSNIVKILNLGNAYTRYIPANVGLGGKYVCVQSTRDSPVFVPMNVEYEEKGNY